MLKEYFELSQQIKELEQKRAELKEKIVKKGTHSSRDFICEVSHQTRRSVSLTNIEKKDKELAGLILDRGFISSSEVVIVKVKAKGKDAA